MCAHMYVVLYGFSCFLQPAPCSVCSPRPESRYICPSPLSRIAYPVSPIPFLLLLPLRLLEKLAPAELLMYVSIRVPLAMSRDACLHAYGADCLHEKGVILLIGNSVEHLAGEAKSEGGGAGGCCEAAVGAGVDPRKHPRSTVEFGQNSVLRKVLSHCVHTACPWKEKGWGQDRMNITEYTAIIEITGPKSARPVIIAKVDPNAGKFLVCVLVCVQAWASRCLFWLCTHTFPKVIPHPLPVSLSLSLPLPLIPAASVGT